HNTTTPRPDHATLPFTGTATSDSYTLSYTTLFRSHLPEEVKAKAEQIVAFPDAAVDRIVPIQHHEDRLAVTVEPFHEWVIDESADRKSTRLNSSHVKISYAVFCLKKKNIRRSEATR